MSSRRSIYGVALAVFTVALAVCAVGAGAALATESPEWQQGKAKLSEAVATKSKGNVKLYDEGLGSEVECESSSAGSAGPGTAGKTTKWTLSSCKATPKALNKKGEEVTNACETAFSAEAKNLAWGGALELVGKSILNDLFEGEGGASPAFEFTCELLGLKMEVKDTCRSSELFRLVASVTNVTGGVDESFDNGGLYCALGGEGGKFETTQLLEATKGAALEANIV